MLLKKSVEKTKYKIIICLFILFISIGLYINAYAFDNKSDVYEFNETVLTRINPETTLQDLRNNLENQGIVVLDVNGEEISTTDYVGTGMKAIINGEEIRLSVLGDVDGNGKVTVTDASKINLHKNNISVLEDNYVASADMNKDGEISITDIVQINQVIVGLKDIVAPNSFEPDVEADERGVIVSGETTDKLSGVKEYWFRIDDDEWVQNVNPQNGTYIFENVNLNEKHNVIMKVLDNLGNEKKTSIKGISIARGSLRIVRQRIDWSNKNVEVYLDLESNVEDTEKYISIDGGETFERYTGPIKITRNTKVVAKLESIKYGILAQDELEIRNIDTLQPKDFIPQVSTNLNTITINVNTDDADATSESGKSGIKNYTYKIKKDNIELTDTSPSPRYTFEDLTSSGEYTVEVIVTDNAKNKRVATTTINLNIDFTVNFNANGGSAEPESITDILGTEVTFGIPTKEGYNFMGWYDNGNFEGDVILPGTKINLSEDKTYYAKWDSNSYVITYNYKGATSGNIVSSKAVAYGEAYGELPEPAKEYRATFIFNDGRENSEQAENYSFDGWYLEDTYENRVDSNSVVATSQNHTLYAKWTIQNSITIPEAGTRVGYDFMGWFENSNFSGSAYTEGSHIASTKDVTMYACWKGQDFNVDYEYNGATSGNFEGGKTVTYGNIYGQLPSPGKQHTITYNLNDGTTDTDTATYAFDNWYKEENFENIVLATTTVNTAQNHIIYVKWNDGALNLLTPNDRYGYSFMGWYETSDFEGPVHIEGETIKPTKDMTFYAKWSQDTSSLTIDANEGIYTGVTLQEQYVGITMRIPEPLKKGYVFNGWEVVEGNGTVSDENFTFGTQNTKLKAKWRTSDETPYKIIHQQMNLDGINYTTVETENLTGTTNDEITPAAKLYTGFTAPATQTTTIAADGSTVVTYRYARNQYTIHFETDGGEEIADVTDYYGKDMTLPIPEKSRAIFENWYTDEELANEVTLTEDGEYIITENITLYVKWGEAKIFVTEYDTDNDGKEDLLAFTANNRTLAEYGVKKGQWDITDVEFTSYKSLPYNTKNVIVIDIVDKIYPTTMAYWFSREFSSPLKTIKNIENIDTSNVTDMKGLFSWCTNLESLDVSGFDTSNVTNMRGMFEGCSRLTSLDVSSFDTSNVIDMSYMFDYCHNLENLDLSSFNTSNVTNMCSMFTFFNGITSLDLSNFDTSNVTNMEFMFEYCNITNITFGSNFITSNVTNMRGMFEGCSHLTSLDVSSFDTSNVTDMQSMFYNCKNIEKLDLTSFNTLYVNNAASMFANCSKLKTINVKSGKWWAKSETMFRNCGTDHVTYV